MGDVEKVVEINLTSIMESTSPLLDKLGTAFAKLKAHEVAASNDLKWSDVEDYFRNLESAMKKKLEDIEAKEKDFTERESRNNMLLDEREAAIVAREQDLLDKVQELKDAAVAAISEAKASYVPEAGDEIGIKLSETVPSVPILQEYLKVIRRNSQGNGSAALQNDYNARELEALKTVIGCVEEYNLEPEYPLYQLYKRVSQLDKSFKGDKEKRPETSKLQRHQQKRPRSDGRFPAKRGRGSGRGFRGGRHGPPPSTGRTSYVGHPQRYPPVVSTPYTYPGAAQSPYGAQASDPGLYYYAQNDQSRNPYSAVPPTYGTYQQPPRQPYM